MESIQGKRSIFYARLCKKTDKWPTGPDQGFSTASCNSCRALPPRGVHPPTSPCPTLSASAEPTYVSLKRIVPTDNMQPKSDDVKTVKLIHFLKSCTARVMYALCVTHFKMFKREILHPSHALEYVCTNVWISSSS